MIFAAGFGTRVSTLSLTTFWTTQNLRGRVFGVVQILENMGKLFAEPGMLKIFAASMDLPTSRLGMPFFLATVRFQCVQ